MLQFLCKNILWEIHKSESLRKLCDGRLFRKNQELADNRWNLVDRPDKVKIDFDRKSNGINLLPRFMMIVEQETVDEQEGGPVAGVDVD